MIKIVEDHFIFCFLIVKSQNKWTTNMDTLQMLKGPAEMFIMVDVQTGKNFLHFAHHCLIGYPVSSDEFFQSFLKAFLNRELTHTQSPSATHRGSYTG